VRVDIAAPAMWGDLSCPPRETREDASLGGPSTCPLW
jgi:hypothetical protein